MKENTLMRHAIAALTALLMLGVIHSVSAQTATLEGTFTASTSEGQQQIERAIETAVAKMNFVTRPIARGRLKKTNPAYQRIRIAQEGSQLSIQFDERAPLQMPADGRPVKWTREDGEVFDVNATREAGAMTQTFKAEDGERINRFSLSPDGNALTLEVTITSPRLPAPVKYSLEYQRQVDRKNSHLEFTGNDR
jgi:hypothetical protein